MKATLPSNREIALEYLAIEVQNSGVSAILQPVRKALGQRHVSEIEFATFALRVAPKGQTVTLLHDWDACAPVTFVAEEFFALVKRARR